MRKLTILALIAVAASGATVVEAEEINHAAQYGACLRLAERQPEEAFDAALAWQALGGGDPARHCAAVALVRIGHHEEGAVRLEALAQTIRAEPRFRARLLGQAGQAWLLAGREPRAIEVLDAAIKLAPDDPALLIDRAQAWAGGGALWEAVDDLNRAIDLDPDNADALAFRAGTYRHLESPDMALSDAERALAVDPDHAEALLEHGLAQRLAGNDAAARQSWLRLIRTRPDGAAAEAARGHLAEMDVKTP